jgi:hypothetical protein
MKYLNPLEQYEVGMQHRHQPHGSVFAGQSFVPPVSEQQNAELADVLQSPLPQLVHDVANAKALPGFRRYRRGETTRAAPTTDARTRSPRRLVVLSSVELASPTIFSDTCVSPSSMLMKPPF